MSRTQKWRRAWLFAGATATGLGCSGESAPPTGGPAAGYDGPAEGGAAGGSDAMRVGDTQPPADAGKTEGDATGAHETGGEAGARTVTVTDGVMHESAECFLIKTPTATYYYDKVGAGFSSIVDNDGNDWISYHPSGGSAGNYRGIPNMGSGCCHAGAPTYHEGAPMTSTVMASTMDRATIHSASSDGRFDVTWEFRSDYATLTINAYSGNYWLLYEGTPGGRFSADDYYRTPQTPSNVPATTSFTGDLSPEWIYFGSSATRRVLFLAHHEDDQTPDSYWPMEGNMTVFGFERDDSISGQGLTNTVPQHLSIGFVESTDDSRIRDAINAAVTGK
jgi:hypothetical protein